MKSEHTHGPWEIDLKSPMTLGGDCRAIEAISEDGQFVEREICSMMFDTEDAPNGKSYLEDIANARLISAAPELLKALKMFMTGEHDIVTYKTGERAIAKAEGK